jgi:alkylation response protein AidB-like acyl-CoA dehydrogenase
MSRAVADQAHAEYPGRAEVCTRFAERADAVDRGDTDVREGLRELGARGLLDLGAPNNRDGSLRAMVQLITDVAAGCLSSGFGVWAQRMVIEYLRQSPVTDGTGARELTEGTVCGSTAMASALRDIAGLAPVPVLARRVATGLVLNGTIPWASNLFPGTVVVLPVRFDDGGRAVVSARTSDHGVHIGRSLDLLALNATASASITLTEAEVPAEAVLSTNLENFVTAIRPTFLLLQSAFCVGLAERSLTETQSIMDGINLVFSDQLDDLAGRYAQLRERLLRFAGRPDQTPHRDLLQLRLDAVTVTTSVTRMEATLRGGPGYAAGSATARRLREAAFLPIQSPTEGQLRWELSRYA